MYSRRKHQRQGPKSHPGPDLEDYNKIRGSKLNITQCISVVGCVGLLLHTTLPWLQPGLKSSKIVGGAPSLLSILTQNYGEKSPSANGDNTKITSSNGGSRGRPVLPTEATAATTLTIPDCPSSPWKPEEELVGTCPGIRPPPNTEFLTNAAACAQSCCDDPDCIVWQFRDDKGCVQGGDVRIGQEKDGPSAYCSDHPPFRWKGQLLKDDRKSTECSTETWHPEEQPGQCFGLGDRRKNVENTAEACMMACCEDETCKAWQFQEELGCFYNRGMHSCQKSDDPRVFEAYIGRRKRLATRKYTDKKGNAAMNWKKSSTSA